MDGEVSDGRDARDVRNVLPRLSDRTNRPDAAASRVNRALETLDAQPFSPSSQQQQQQQQHQQQQQQQQKLPHPGQPTHSSQLQQPHELPLPVPLPSSFQSSSRHYFQQQQQPPHHPPQLPHLYSHTANGSDSQETAGSADTTASTDTDRLFTPPISDGGLSVGGGGSGSVNGSGNACGYEHEPPSQESQLLQLSTLAAASERMADIHAMDVSDADANASSGAAALSRKRTADGSVKHVRTTSSASPVFTGGHSRNTSTVSIASTTGSRIGELSAELKARLSYAMVKVNNGWQAHTIDQVESFASHAASPTSSTSTINGRHGPSVSPRLPGASAHHRQLSQASGSTFAGAPTMAASGRSLSAIDASAWSSQPGLRSNHTTPPLPSPLAPPRTGSTAPARSLAPPVSIQPAQPSSMARRNSNPAHAVSSFSSYHAHQASPHTPGMGPDPILFSPHQNVREQDAIETLLFMSSPGNSANMKHFPSTSASQPLPSGYHDPHQHHQQQQPLVPASPQRHALPSAPRKSLPTGRPTSSQTYGSQPPPSSNRRAGPDRTPGHHRSPSDMELDDPYGTPRSRAGNAARGTPRRRANGTYHAADVPMAAPRLKAPLSMPSGLSLSSKPRPVLGEDDIEKMLDRAAAAEDDDSSDSDSEILIPVRRSDPVEI